MQEVLSMRIQVYNDWDQIPKAESSGREEAILAWHGEYCVGDVIRFDGLETGNFYVVKVDAALDDALVYMTADAVRFQVPFNEHKAGYNPLAFAGCRHYISIRKARPEELYSRHNLARNPLDQETETIYDGTKANHRKGQIGGIGTASGEGTGAGGTIRACETHVFPHASDNLGTPRNPDFAARNAIDGTIAVSCHGEWPYESWGIDRRGDAQFRLDFGYGADIDEIALYTRADFPHDSWWKRGTFHFSDGTEIPLAMEKRSQSPHILGNLKLSNITWLTLGDLEKADDPSPFPALTQIEVYGIVSRKQ